MAWDPASARRLGLAIRRLRERDGLSQESLAFRAGVTKNQVQLIEAGRASGRKDGVGPSNPRLSTLIGIAEVLNVDASTILHDAEL